MPAHEGSAAHTGAGVRKPPMEKPREGIRQTVRRELWKSECRVAFSVSFVGRCSCLGKVAVSSVRSVCPHLNPSLALPPAAAVYRASGFVRGTFRT